MLITNLSFALFITMAVSGTANGSDTGSNLRGLAPVGNGGRALGKCYKCSKKNKNPCLDDDADQYYKHCNSNKYIQCGPENTCYDMDCAPGTMWDQKKLACVHSDSSSSSSSSSTSSSSWSSSSSSSSSGSKDSKSSKDSRSKGSKSSSSSEMETCGSCDYNPCTEEAIDAGEFYHEHCSRSKKYLQCGAAAGMCHEMDCAPGTMWDQKKLTCVHSAMGGDSSSSSSDSKGNKGSSEEGGSEPKMGNCGSCDYNPCTEEAIEAGEFYHEHCSRSKKYLQCGAAGTCYEVKCAPGTVWRQHKLTCVAESN